MPAPPTAPTSLTAGPDAGDRGALASGADGGAAHGDGATGSTRPVRSQPLPPLGGDRSADVLVVGGGYTGLWTAWHLKRLEPDARGRRCSRPRSAGRARAGATVASQRALVQPAHDARALRRRGGASPSPAPRRTRSTRSASSAREQDVDAWFTPGGYLQVSTAPAWDGAWDEAVRPAASSACPTPCAALTPSEVRGALRLAALPRRRLLSGSGDRAAGAARPRPARPAPRRRGRVLRADRGSAGRAPRRRGRRRDGRGPDRAGAA